MITAKYESGYADKLVHTGPCLVIGFHVKADAVAAEVRLTDAVVAGYMPFRKAEPAADTFDDFRFNPPVEFKTGIFIDVVTAPEFWTVEFIV